MERNKKLSETETEKRSMECNKEEAVRAKEIAEKKFMEMDITGAKRFALKAENLHHGLDGLPQLLATLDIYIFAEKKINGDVDWYRVLGVEPWADDDTIRRQYKKMAFILHPDRNKSVGADGAFKILSDAWSLLSDKTKRIAYDQKRNLRGIYEKIPTGKPSMPASQNGFHSFTSNHNLYADQKSHTYPKPAVLPPYVSKPNTFWTICNACKMQFEFLRSYLNHNLLCPNCRQPFVAVETQQPPLNGNSSSSQWTSYGQLHNSVEHTLNNISHASGRKLVSATNLGTTGFPGVGSFKTATFQSGINSNSAGVRSVAAPASLAAQATGGVRTTCEQLKRGREEPQTAAAREDAFQRKTHAFKKTGAGLSTGSSNTCPSSALNGDRPKKKRRRDGRGVANQMAMEIQGIHMGGVPGSQKGSFETGRVNFAGNNKPNSTRELRKPEIRSILMEKVKKVIRNELREWSAVSKTSDKSTTSDKKVREKEEGKQKATVSDVKTDANKCKEYVVTKDKQSSVVKSSVDSDIKSPDAMTMSVPDPDFHDFDNDRSEKSFGDNQVWAAYDDDDGMPRYYAMIHRVISLKPFKMRISWLNSKTNSELGPLKWIGSGFSKTSGDFRIGKHEVYNSINSFSHKVEWTKGTRGAIRIYPRRGDVWALYRNWSPNWNELTPDEVIHKYDMVEVLEDYNEERGVTVTPLVKVAGFRTVFHQHLNPKELWTIPREEMFRFSHQVPSYLLTGQEGHNAPKECWELDPASTPLELLQIIKEGEMGETAEKAKEEDLLGGVKEFKKEEVDNGKATKEIGISEDTGKKVVTEGMMKGKETKEKKMLVYKRRHQKLKEEKRQERAK